MLIKIALNGARGKEQNENVPHSLSEIEKEVKQLYEYGSKIFHIHCYDKNGNESLKPDDVNDLVSLIKNISPSIQLGISSGEWIEPDLEKRKKYISEWKGIPDFISVNMIEDDAVEICRLLALKGVYIEAGLNEKKAAEIFVANKPDRVCRILIEPEAEELGEALETIDEIEQALDKNDVRIPRLLHGFNGVSWELMREAKRRGYAGRTGMEDVLFLENGKAVKSNLEIIKYADDMLRDFK